MSFIPLKYQKKVTHKLLGKKRTEIHSMQQIFVSLGKQLKKLEFQYEIEFENIMRMKIKILITK